MCVGFLGKKGTVAFLVPNKTNKTLFYSLGKLGKLRESIELLLMFYPTFTLPFFRFFAHRSPLFCRCFDESPLWNP
jgi:hypothetical protein